MPLGPLQGRFWRLLAPRWGDRPLSGGRWNRPGTPALSMSRDLTAAVAEYEQDLGIRPGTFCAYNAHASTAVDLTDPDTLARLGTCRADLPCDWALIARAEGRDPPTWRLAERLPGCGAEGILAPSAKAPGGVNLVIWRWQAETGDGMQVVALDPQGGPSAQPILLAQTGLSSDLTSRSG